MLNDLKRFLPGLCVIILMSRVATSLTKLQFCGLSQNVIHVLYATAIGLQFVRVVVVCVWVTLRAKSQGFNAVLWLLYSLFLGELSIVILVLFAQFSFNQCNSLPDSERTQ